MRFPLLRFLLPVALLAPRAIAQVTVPSGFVSKSIPFGAEVTGIAVSPGGAWGDNLYVSTNGAVKRVDLATDTVNSFATGLATGAGRPSGVTFDSGSFGTGALYVAQNNSTVVVIASTGVVSPFSSAGSLFSCNDLVMAPTGSAFGAKLFVANGSPGSGTISGVTSAGVNALFAASSNFSNAPLGVDFPPAGSSFGSDLYTSIYLTGQFVRVSSSGTGTLHTSGLGLSLDFVFSRDPSGPFGDFAYVTDSGANIVRRVSPDGTVTTFATGLAFGTTGFDGDLAFSPDGRTLFIGSGASIVQIRACGVVSTYCTAKTNSAGCTPSIGSSGTPSASAGSGFHVSATQVLAGKAGLLFYSTHGGGGSPFQGGFLCATPPTKRTPLQTSSASGSPPCTGVYTLDFNARISSGIDPTLVEGQQVWSQYWTRDGGSSAGTGLTNGLSFTICQ